MITEKEKKIPSKIDAKSFTNVEWVHIKAKSAGPKKINEDNNSDPFNKLFGGAPCHWIGFFSEVHARVFLCFYRSCNRLRLYTVEDLQPFHLGTDGSSVAVYPRRGVLPVLRFALV